MQPSCGCQKVPPFGLPTGEGAPQGLRGWGVRLRGSGETFPSGFGQRPWFWLPLIKGAGGRHAKHDQACIWVPNTELASFRRGRYNGDIRNTIVTRDSQ
ncbi:hypothetical protein COJ48_28335 [Bacillus cereus]|nr:hypothetical protein COJ48_28335 [Bacillus cereus]PGP75179.1 hypothetical protein CN997_26055 [Bacillus cereus]